MIGGTLGRLWREAGHEVRFGTRHPETIAALAGEIGAVAGSAAEAAAFAEVVLLAVPLKAMPELGASLGPSLAGKVVLDANNAYPDRDGDAARAASAGPAGSSSWVAGQLPGARVVKAFNTVYFKVLLEKSHNGDLGIPLAGDDPAAVAIAEGLVRDAGFVPVVVGELSRGKAFEPGTPVYNTGMGAPAVAKALGVTGG
jgi:predicted dinucleotide-binding enzyme